MIGNKSSSEYSTPKDLLISRKGINTQRLGGASQMNKLVAFLMALCVITSTFVAGPLSVSTAYAKQNCTKVVSANSTECKDAPVITYHGTQPGTPPLLPTVCVNDEAYGLMTGPGVDFWFTYYQKYRNGGIEDMPRKITARCVTRQKVFPGVRIGFWFDCNGYRYWYESDPITDNGRYEMHFVKKQPV